MLGCDAGRSVGDGAGQVEQNLSMAAVARQQRAREPLPRNRKLVNAKLNNNFRLSGNRFCL